MNSVQLVQCLKAAVDQVGTREAGSAETLYLPKALGPWKVVRESRKEAYSNVLCRVLLLGPAQTLEMAGIM